MVIYRKDAMEAFRKLVEAESVYCRFIELHPNAAEPFQPTPENVARWQWHIKQSECQPKLEQLPIPDTTNARMIAEGRSFKTFDDFPPYMQERYLQITTMFPGVQFYACGSRVTGEYIEQWSGEGVKELRKELGKTEKLESDYDVCFSFPHGYAWQGDNYKTGTLEIQKALPEWADLIFGVPDNEKIPIPMWNFDHLPESEHEKVIHLFETNQMGELMVIHNKYKLSNYDYCCNETPIREWFGWGIETGRIKKAKITEVAE